MGIRYCFFHFSGFNPRQPQQLSHFQNRFPPLDQQHTLYALLQDYAQRLAEYTRSCPLPKVSPYRRWWHAARWRRVRNAYFRYLAKPPHALD